MAGMTGHRSRGTSINSKAGVPAVKKKAGGGGGVVPAAAQGANPAAVTWVWAANQAAPNQIIFTTSVNVIWSGGIPINWRLKQTNVTLLVSSVTQLTPTTWQITFNGAVNATTGALSIGQLDPTFKSAQGGFLQPGTQFAGPQK